MGTVFRKTITRPLPAGAELFEKSRKPTVAERAENPDLREVVERFARWRDKKRRLHVAPVTTGNDGTLRLSVESGTFVAKYRDGEGIVRTVPTGARTEAGALSVLGDLEKQAEKVRCNILTPAESNAAEFQRLPIADHFAAYLDHQTAKGLNAVRIRNTASRLKRITHECSFGRLSDLDVNTFERWLAIQTVEGMSPGNRNEFRQELVGFGNWCVKSRRLLANPFLAVPRADARANPNRKRRSMTEHELRRLLYVAHWRPLAEYGRESISTDANEAEGAGRGRKRSNWTYAALAFDDLEAAVARARERLVGKPAFVAELEQRGRERALIYKTLVLTGLRKGELASLTVGQVDLEAAPPFVTLNAADEKNRQGSTLPLRADLAADLRQWLDDKATVRQDAARNAPTLRIDAQPVKPGKHATGRIRRREGHSCQGATTLPPGERLFDIPTGLVRILDRDLQAAGIAKRDDRGRTLDVHALRHSFGTLLSKGGVSPRTAQAAMRHSSVDLTMNVYTDPRLLDVHAAVDALPELLLEGLEPSRQFATGTAGDTTYDRVFVAPIVAPTRGNGSQFRSIPGKTTTNRPTRNDPATLAASCLPVKRNNPLSLGDNGLREVERKGVEPSTSALRTQAGVVPTGNPPELTTSPDSGCTNCCTNSPPSVSNADPLATLADALRQLSPADRERLAALLANPTGKESAR